MLPMYRLPAELRVAIGFAKTVNRRIHDLLTPELIAQAIQEPEPAERTTVLYKALIDKDRYGRQLMLKKSPVINDSYYLQVGLPVVGVGNDELGMASMELEVFPGDVGMNLRHFSVVSPDPKNPSSIRATRVGIHATCVGGVFQVMRVTNILNAEAWRLSARAIEGIDLDEMSSDSQSNIAVIRQAIPKL